MEVIEFLKFHKSVYGQKNLVLVTETNEDSFGYTNHKTEIMLWGQKLGDGKMREEHKFRMIDSFMLKEEAPMKPLPWNKARNKGVI